MFTEGERHKSEFGIGGCRDGAVSPDSNCRRPDAVVPLHDEEHHCGVGVRCARLLLRYTEHNTICANRSF